MLCSLLLRKKRLNLLWIPKMRDTMKNKNSDIFIPFSTNGCLIQYKVISTQINMTAALGLPVAFGLLSLLPIVAAESSDKTNPLSSQEAKSFLLGCFGMLTLKGFELILDACLKKG